ncbi:MAG: hypothetical protein Q9N34_09560 [Aquificota bacterium]|nr:hypothetical protein [Aquificota bacterium]
MLRKHQGAVGRKRHTPLWQRALLLIIFPAVVVGALWFYMVKPSQEERDRLRQERQRLIQEINRYRAMIRAREPSKS